MAVSTLIQGYPFLSMMAISFVVTLATTLIYKYTTNQENLKSMKEEIKQYQKQMKAERENPKRMMELQKSAMEANLKYMKQTFKPMIITLLPLLLLFSWLRGVYSTVGIDNITGNATGKIFIPVASISLGWIWVYIISAVLFSVVLRKVLKVY